MKNKRTSGQALVMVTLALIAMCGMMGLAVDLGWSFFVQKQAQVAADSAALAAVQALYSNLNGTVPTLSCGGLVTCSPTPTDCASIGSTGNLASGCAYATANSRAGRTMAGFDGRRQLSPVVPRRP